MSVYLYPNFLSDPAEYAKAEDRWFREWAELLKVEKQEWLWKTPWLKNTFANGEPCQDGNPIFSSYSPRLQLGVRVIQLEAEGPERDLYAWVDTFAKGEPETITELVISCVLTEQTLPEAIDLFKRWVRDKEAVEVPFAIPQFGAERTARPKTRPRRLDVALV